MGPINGINHVSYNAITQTLNILTSDETFVSGTNGPSGAKFMIKISDVTESFITFPSSSTLSTVHVSMGPLVPPTQAELELGTIPVGTVINMYYTNDLQNLVFENVQLRSTQQVELFMVDSNDQIVYSVVNHDITDKLREASFGPDIPTDKPSVIGISQDNKSITLKVTKIQRDNWVIYEDTTIEIKLWNHDNYLDLTNTSETSNTGITLGTSDMKMSFNDSISQDDYELVLDVTDDYNLDEPATLHFTFYNGKTEISPYTEVRLPTCGSVTQNGISCAFEYSNYDHPPCARDNGTSTWYKAEPSAGSKYVFDECLAPIYQQSVGHYRQQVNFKKEANANCYGPETRTEFNESRNGDLLRAHGCPI